MGKNVARLFEQFQPEHYDLRFTIDPERMFFEGTVTIRGKKAGRPAERLVFHQKELKVVRATVTKHDKKGDLNIPVNRINNQESLNEVRIHSSEKIFPGDYSVTLEFTAAITRPMNG